MFLHLWKDWDKISQCNHEIDRKNMIIVNPTKVVLVHEFHCLQHRLCESHLTAMVYSRSLVNLLEPILHISGNVTKMVSLVVHRRVTFENKLACWTHGIRISSSNWHIVIIVLTSAWQNLDIFHGFLKLFLQFLAILIHKSRSLTNFSD